MYVLPEWLKQTLNAIEMQPPSQESTHAQLMHLYLIAGKLGLHDAMECVQSLAKYVDRTPKNSDGEAA